MLRRQEEGHFGLPIIFCTEVLSKISLLFLHIVRCGLSMLCVLSCILDTRSAAFNCFFLSGFACIELLEERWFYHFTIVDMHLTKAWLYSQTWDINNQKHTSGLLVERTPNHCDHLDRQCWHWLRHHLKCHITFCESKKREFELEGGEKSSRKWSWHCKWAKKTSKPTTKF